MVFSRRISTNSASKSMFAPIWEEIKKPLYIPFYIILFYKIISLIQVLVLTLDISMTFFDNTDGTWRFTFVRAFTFYKCFDLEDLDAVAKAACIISFIIIWILYFLIVAVFISIKFRIQYLYALAKPMKHLLMTHQFIMFLPIHVLAIETINIYTNISVSRSAVMVSLAALTMSMNFVLGLLTMRCYSPLYAQKIYAKRNAELVFCDFAFKVFTATCLVFVAQSTAIKWVTVIASLIHALILHYKFHTQLPYFQIKLLDAYCFILGANCSMCLSIFICAIFDEFRVITVPDLPLGGFFLSLYITITGQMQRVRKTVIKALTFEEHHYKTEHDVFVHLIALRYLFKKAAYVSFKLGKRDTTNWSMTLNGVLAKHNEKCTLTTCGCRMVLEQDETFRQTGVKREKFKDLLVVLMRELYEKGVEKVNSELILLNLAQFYLLYLKNYLRSYLVLQTFEKNPQKSFETEVLIEYLKKRVQERMELKLSGGGTESIDSYNSNSLNLTALVQNDILFIQLKKLVHEQAVKQLKFWDMLDNYELNTRNIEAGCEEVDVIRNKIERLWESLSRINQKCSSHYLLYGLYQTLINNTVKRGERFLNDYSRMQGVNLQEKEGITNENLYDAQTVVVRISMRRDKIGLIEECSGDVESIFGYSGTELMNSNVATLMSNFFKERHHTFVMNHFEKGTENVLNRQKNLYGYHKEGHIFPIFLYVSIYPNIETGLSYMGIIRNKKVYNNYILLKSDGTVDSYSPEIAEYLGLESRKRYNIVEICPEFGKINHAFNYTTTNKYDNLKENDEFKADSLQRKQVDTPQQVKAGDSDSQRLTVDNSKMKKDGANSMNSGFEDVDKATSVMEAKEENSMIKIRDRLNAALRPLGKMKPVQKKLRRLNTDEIDEYKRVYEQMTISGSVLSFVPQRERQESGIKNFLCTVADEIFDYSILRIITLGRNDENVEAGERNKKQAMGREGSFRDISFMEREIMMNSEQDDMGISKVPNNEEDNIFKNPFAEGENKDNNGIITIEIKGSNRSNKPNKSAILKLLKTSHENFDTQANLVGGKSGVYDMSHMKENISRNVSMLSDAKTVNYSDAEHEQFDTGFNDSRDFIQEMTQNDGLFHQGDTSSTSTNITTRSGAISKFEALLYKKEEARISNKFRSYFLIIAACIVMAVVSTTTTNNNLQQGSQKVQKLLSVGQRIDTVLNLNYNCRILYLYLNNYINETRHLADKGITNYPQVALDNVMTDATTLPTVNVAVMNDIYTLHAVSQPKFFDTQVTINYPTTSLQDHNVNSLDTFEAVDTLTTAALEISSVNLSTLNSTQTDNIDYILLNSMNDLYIQIQDGYKIYEDDLEETLAGTQTVTWGIAIGVVSIYGVFLVILIRDLANTHQDKIRFWNSLIKLDTMKSMGHRKLLMVFKENFENASGHAPLKKALMEAKKQELKELRATKAKESQANVFKRLKNYKLRNRSYFTIFPFLLVLAIIIAFFVLTEVLVVNQLEGKRIYMQEIKQSETFYQLNILTMNGIYEYISEGATRQLESEPIVTAIDANLAILAQLTDFSSGFESHPSFDPKAFLQMNLCNIYTTAKDIQDCTLDGNGINLQGMLGILTFAKEALQSAMDYATSMTSTTANIVTAFQSSNLIILETELKYITDGFTIMAQSLADSEIKQQDNFRALQIVTILVFVVILLVLNYFMVWRGFKRLDGQKFDNMKILRVIPTPMILESKMMKTYLLKSFKDDLSSITNKL